MKDLFVGYEESLKLKELGFDEPCFGYYYPNIRSADMPILLASKNDYDWDVEHEPITNSKLSSRIHQPQVAAPTYLQKHNWEKSKIVLE